MGYKSICGKWARFVLGCDETSDQKIKPFDLAKNKNSWNYTYRKTRILKVKNYVWGLKHVDFCSNYKSLSGLPLDRKKI